MTRAMIRRRKLHTNDVSHVMALTVHTATATISSQSECRKIFRRLWRREQQNGLMAQQYRKHYRVEVKILPSKELYWTLFRMETSERINGGLADDLHDVTGHVYHAVHTDRIENGAVHDDPEPYTGPSRWPGLKEQE
jgi:hypothetical protein